MNDVLYDKFCYYNGTLNWDYYLWAFSQYLWINFKFLLCMLSRIVYSELITFHELDLFTVFAELITLSV